jgi:hypothetical protein
MKLNKEQEEQYKKVMKSLRKIGACENLQLNLMFLLLNIQGLRGVFIRRIILEGLLALLTKAVELLSMIRIKDES